MFYDNVMVLYDLSTLLKTCYSACTTTQYNEYKNCDVYNSKNKVKTEVSIKWTTYGVNDNISIELVQLC